METTFIYLLEKFELLKLLPSVIRTMMLFYLLVKVLDFTTGLLKTYKSNEIKYKSSKMRDGILRWIGELVALTFVMAFDAVMGLQFYLTGLTLTLFVYKEAGSVLENLGQIGVELPGAVKDHLEVLNNKEEKAESKDNGLGK